MTKEVLSHFTSADELAKQAARDLAEKILGLLDSQSVNVVLTGGTVGTKTLAELAPLLQGKDLENLHLWWSDERFVPVDSPDRNFVQATEALLSKISIPPGNLHQMPAAGAKPLLEAAADFADQVSEAAPSLDIVLLGVGPDAHVASLFPGSSPMNFGELVVAEANSPKPPAERISLSYSALSSGNEVWFLVAGDDKAEAVSRVFGGEQLPASRVSGRSITRWYLDTAAATKLAL